MKNWTGKIFLCLSFVLWTACSSAPSNKPASKDEVDPEVSLKEDKSAIEELRKDVPEEIRKSNDRLAEVLKRWKISKMAPEELRSRFNDEIRKMRENLDKKQRRLREDFQRQQTDKRRAFQDEKKEERDDFYSTKPSSDRRSAFNQKQSLERDRFNADLRDERDRFEGDMKDERKIFEADIASRWTEFRQEFPEYQRLYKDMKAEEERQKEDAKEHPKPYTGWPYKYDDEKGKGAPGGAPSAQRNEMNSDVNKGGDGWPTTDPSEFRQLPPPPGH